MTQYIEKSALVAEIKRLLAFYSKEIEDNKEDPWAMDIAKRDILQEILSFLDTLEVKDVQEEPVSEVLEEAANDYVGHAPEIDEDLSCFIKRSAFIAGAKWKKENLWKNAQGNNLPEIDREVIVLYQPYPYEGKEYVVSFAHRPNPNGWDGKSVITGKVEHYIPETYDKGEWNIPNIVWWLDLDLPIKGE